MRVLSRDNGENVDNPLVSICIPNYNNGKYLDSCVASALSQEYSNIEVILVDDNSTDNSLEIAKKYESNVTIIKNINNLGQPKNTNKVVNLASGEFVVILHSDDQLLPNFCTALVPLLCRYPNAVMAVGERKETDESGIAHSITPFYSVDCVIPGEKQAKVFLMMSFLPCQVLFRKNRFVESGQINERHIVNLDGLLWFQMSLLGDVIYIRDELSVYRIHKNNITSEYNKKINHMMEYYGTMSEMFDMAKGRPYLEFYFKDAQKRVALLTIRYCHEVIKNKNYELAKQYIALARVFDEDIVNDKMYKLIKYSLESELDDPVKVYESLMVKTDIRRMTSYEPPEGFVALQRM